jgi:hypothetical protein
MKQLERYNNISLQTKIPNPTIEDAKIDIVSKIMYDITMSISKQIENVIRNILLDFLKTDTLPPDTHISLHLNSIANIAGHTTIRWDEIELLYIYPTYKTEINGVLHFSRKYRILYPKLEDNEIRYSHMLYAENQYEDVDL